ncbi:hypothetical protein J6590_076286 [Homalodisca vitripennis]|nr:hypothetical protein J6590_076286 [Homalodisca vitripennis]
MQTAAQIWDVSLFEVPRAAHIWDAGAREETVRLIFEPADMLHIWMLHLLQLPLLPALVLLAHGDLDVPSVLWRKDTTLPPHHLVIGPLTNTCDPDPPPHVSLITLAGTLLLFNRSGSPRYLVVVILVFPLPAVSKMIELENYSTSHFIAYLAV